MDCEKVEPMLLDELYDELDEVTSAAVRRHVGSCGRCAGTLNGLRATRRLAVLPLVETPAELEERILAAAKEAQRVVPIQSRFGSALSWAGRWAMRPQTAMAAVFLLMIGTSAFLIRANKDMTRPASVSVTEQGAPAAAPTVATAAADPTPLDSPAAASAHGHSGNALAAAPAPPPPAARAPAIVAAKEETAAPNDKGTDGDPGGALATADRETDEKKREAEKKTVASRGDGPGNAGPPAGAPMKPMSRPPAADEAQETTQAPAAAAGAALAQAGGKKGDAQDGFSQGMALYRARNYADAARQFDSAAQTGDLNSALWAARSVKDGAGGCVAALPRYESIAQRSAGTWIGNEASLEAARCQMALGRLDAARDRLNRLAQAPSHAQQAQQALGELNQVATRKRAAGADTGGAGAARRAAPAPAAPKAPARPSPAADGF